MELVSDGRSCSSQGREIVVSLFHTISFRIGSPSFDINYHSVWDAMVGLKESDGYAMVLVGAWVLLSVECWGYPRLYPS